MKIIYIIQPFYLPGENAGGPVQSIRNLIENLGEDYTFRIITKNHDFKENVPYKGIITNKWIDYEKFQIIYLEDKEYKIKNFKKIIKNSSDTIVYLQSYFSKTTIYFMLSRKFRFFNNIKFIVAPRGEFSKGSLNIKRIKKTVFIKFAKAIDLYNNLVWQVTNEKELKDAICVYPRAIIKIASNIPVKYKPFKKHIEKKKNNLKIVFISRINKSKNLKYSLKLLEKINIDQGLIEYNIYGPKEDEEYYKECMDIINKLNNDDRFLIKYHGKINASDAVNIFRENHLFLFPTLGENFGHVILECLTAQTPLLISDQTYFNDLSEFNIGFNIALNNPEEFCEKIDMFYKMNQLEYDRFLGNYQKYIEKKVNIEEIKKQYRALFND